MVVIAMSKNASTVSNKMVKMNAQIRFISGLPDGTTNSSRLVSANGIGV